MKRLRNGDRAKRAPSIFLLPFSPSPCFVLSLVLLGACTQRAQIVASSSTIVMHEGSIWLTSPDDGAVVEIDPDSLEVRRTIPIDGEPAQLAFVGERLIVTLAQSSEIAVIEGDTVHRIATPCGGTR